MTPSPVAVRPPVASASLLSPSLNSPVCATSARATSVNVCAASASAIPRPLERLEVAGSPFERGCAIGAHFGDKIRDRVAKAPFLHDDMIPFARTGDGAALLNAFAESNRAQYPEYWEELRGMAAGSTVPFHQLLLLNLRKEFGAFLPSLNAPATSAVLPESATLDRRTQYGIASDDCTDVLLLTDDVAAVGHNEDADYSIVDNSFFIRMHTGSRVAVMAYTYVGELPSFAFAFNEAAMQSPHKKSNARRNCVAASLCYSHHPFSRLCSPSSLPLASPVLSILFSPCLSCALHPLFPLPLLCSPSSFPLASPVLSILSSPCLSCALHPLFPLPLLCSPSSLPLASPVLSILSSPCLSCALHPLFPLPLLCSPSSLPLASPVLSILSSPCLSCALHPLFPLPLLCSPSSLPLASPVLSILSSPCLSCALHPLFPLPLLCSPSSLPLASPVLSILSSPCLSCALHPLFPLPLLCSPSSLPLASPVLSILSSPCLSCALHPLFPLPLQAFTMDAVPPAPSEVVQGGIARNFLARSLMEARCIEDALQRVTGPAVAVGHHYVLMDFARRRIVSVETASNGRHSILELGRNPQLRSQGESEGEKAVEVGREESERGVSGSETAGGGGGGSGGDEGMAYVLHANVGMAYVLHANAYTRLQLRLPVPQKMGTSSHRRQATARRLGAPTTTQGMLQSNQLHLSPTPLELDLESNQLHLSPTPLELDLESNQLHPSLSPLPLTPPSHPSLSPLPLTPPSHPSLSPLPLTPPSHPSLSPLPLTPPSHPSLSSLPSLASACRGSPDCRLQILSNSDDGDFPIFNAGKVYDAGGEGCTAGVE
ncbi:unnamed protein product [Closterium sp. NIES-65]|nr:unnamed protein product [Closterium sp. NIES-65]